MAASTVSETAEVVLCLLGQPCLRVAARRLALSAKDAALLALVARDGPLRAERAAALLWPQASARQADNSLRQRLYRLRREAVAPLLDSGVTLVLRPEVVTDLAVELERIADDDQAASGELLGELAFDNLPEFVDWLRTQRALWRQQRAAALAAAADRCEKAGALARGLVYAQRQLDDEPLAEHAQRRLMRLHYLRGDRAAAIASFERFERQLKDELGTRPSAETLELLATIEQGAALRHGPRAVVPASLMRPPRLVGRAGELDRIARAWDSGRVVLLQGEAGIGKSRLLAEVAAGQDGLLMVSARPGDAGIAHALLARLLRAALAAHNTLALDAARRSELALVLPELGEAVAVVGDARRLMLQRAVEATLGDALLHGLRALLIDDLHFADDASLGIVQCALQAEPLAALRWALTQRPAAAAGTLAALRAALEDGARAETLALAPLGQDHLVELVASLGLAELDAARLAPALLRHTGGNPLFVLETLKDLVLHAGRIGDGAPLPQPASIGALVERRLAQLTPPALRLARTAALAGGNFDAELAAAVLESHPLDLAEPWRELEAAQVIRDGAFAHDLIFEATRESVPLPIAQLLHLRIAEHLAARGIGGAAIAPHWAGALQWQRAGEAQAQAARQARSASQRAHEVECWRRAAEAFDRAGLARQAFDARCESVPACIVAQGVEAAAPVIDALLLAASDDAQRAAAFSARATAALMAADHVAGLAAAGEAARLARTLGSPWPGFEAARLLAVGLAIGGRSSEALAAIEPYRELVERDGDAEQRGHFWADYAYVLNGARRLRDTAFALQQAMTHARALGDLAELATLTSNLATVKGNLGLVHEALELAQRALALQTQLGSADGPAGAVVEAYVGLYLGMVGRYSEALQRLEAAIQRFERDKQLVWTALACNHLAQLLLDLGQHARARQALQRAGTQVDHTRARGAQVAARIERALGQTGSASMQRALAALAPGSDPHVRMQVLLDAAPADEPQAALARCDEVLALAQRLEFGGVAMKARLRRAQAQARAGEMQGAAQAMRDCVAQIDTLPPADMTLGEAWWIAAQVFDASGDGDDALMALGRGAQWLRRTALPNVPDDYRESFLQRNRSHRALLAAADRRLGGRAR